MNEAGRGMGREGGAAGPGPAAARTFADPAPGWAALAFAVAFPAFGTWLYFIEATGSAWIHLVYALVKVIQFGFPVAFLVAARGMGPRAVAARLARAMAPGPGGRGAAAGALSGAAMGVVILGAYGLILRGSPSGAAVTAQLASRLAEIGASTPLGFLALALFLSLIHSFLEETYWRWFVFDGLLGRMGAGPALGISSVAFTAHHVLVLWFYLAGGPGAGLIGPFAAGVAAGGAVWAWQYHRYGSLAPPWISHVLADLAIMAAGYDLALA